MADRANGNRHALAAHPGSDGAASPPRADDVTPSASQATAPGGGGDRAQGDRVDGKVIGWNRGGFHVVLDASTTAFCPRSEMELGRSRDPKGYLDQTFTFRVIEVRDGGRRVIVSRAALLREQRREKLVELSRHVTSGEPLTGRVRSLTDFGAFVDLGGLEGLVHVSEISRERVEHPREKLDVGQEIEVKVLKIEEDGDRISLSMRLLEPDPWKGLGQRLRVGSVVTGRVERVAPFGAFVEVAPGLTGLLPTSAMALPREASAARAYPPGKEIAVQVTSIDARRRRISLALEGAGIEGSQADYRQYLKERKESESTGFTALAAAFRKIDPS